MRLLFLDKMVQRRRRFISVAAALATLIGVAGCVTALFFTIGYLVTP
jgi:hypothetical protein